MLAAPLQLGALSVRLVRLWVNPALQLHKTFQSCLKIQNNKICWTQ